MPKAKINHAERAKAARLEWNKVAKRAHEQGYSNIVRRYQPNSVAGWAIIEAACRNLRRVMQDDAEAAE